MTSGPGRERQAPALGAEHPAAHGELHPARESISATVTVAVAYAAVEQALRIGPDHLIALAYLSASTTEDGRFDAILTTRGWRRWLRLPAGIEFRRTPREAHAVVHLSWRARWRPHLFPVMEANIGLRPDSLVELPEVGPWAERFDNRRLVIRTLCRPRLREASARLILFRPIVSNPGH